VEAAGLLVNTGPQNHGSVVSPIVFMCPTQEYVLIFEERYLETTLVAALYARTDIEDHAENNNRGILIDETIQTPVPMTTSRRKKFHPLF
jgi:hypothetical protein